ncbi:MAG: HD-GYP domain-containing protein [Deltaproteobacteria bacterium]
MNLNSADFFISVALFGISTCLTLIGLIRLFTRYWRIENKRQFSLFILLTLSTSIWSLGCIFSVPNEGYSGLQWLGLFLIAFFLCLYFLSLRQKAEPDYRIYTIIIILGLILASCLAGLMIGKWRDPTWILISAACISIAFIFVVYQSFELSRLENNSFLKLTGSILAVFALLNVMDNLSGILWTINAHYLYLGGALIFSLLFGVYVMDQAYINATRDLGARLAEVENEYAAAVENIEHVVISLARSLEAKDKYTEGHSSRVSHYAVLLGEALGLPANSLEELRIGGLVHDIGKIGIDQQVLNKPGPLDAEERSIMENHPAVGERICSPLESFQQINPIIRGHHEKLNGTGYPDRLVADDLSQLVRIITIVDIYDALTSDRPYRPAMDFGRAFGILKEEASEGKLDVYLVDLFIAALSKGLT